jgi:hypothetical protein
MAQVEANVNIIGRIAYGVNLIEKNGKKYVQGTGTYRDRDFFRQQMMIYNFDDQAYAVNDEQLHEVLQFYGQRERDNANLSREMWKQACMNKMINFARKGTDEYRIVKTEFQKLMKEKTNQ